MTRYNLTCRLDNDAEKVLYYPGGSYCNSSYKTVYAYIYDSITVDSLAGYGVGPGGFDSTTGSFSWYTTPYDLWYAPSDWVRTQTINFYYYTDAEVYVDGSSIDRTLSTSYTVPTYWDSGYTRVTYTDSLIQAESISWGGHQSKNAVKAWDKKVWLSATLIGSTTYGAYSQTLRSAINKPGYTQTGWRCFEGPYKNSPYNPYSVGGGFEVGRNNAAGYTVHKFKAEYRAHTFQVKYNANGGTGTMGNSSFTYDKTNKLASNSYSRTGYTFKGWATSKARADAGTVDYNNGADVGNLTTEDGKVIELFAVWSIISYTVSYNANSSNVSSVPAAQTKYYGQTLKLSDKTPIKAQDNSTYTVNFKNDTGNPVQPQQVTSKKTYTFSIWTTNSNGTGDRYQLSGNYTKNEPTTLYAQWGQEVTTTGFKIPAASKPKSIAKDAKSVNFDTMKGSEVKPIKFDITTNYGFNWWTVNPDGTGGRYYSGNTYAELKSRTLYAQYSTTLEAEEIVLPAAPTKAGSIFNGWWSEKSGGDFIGNPGAKYIPPTSGTTIYARWIDGTNVTFNYNGNGHKNETLTFVRGSTNYNSRTPLPTRKGFYFDGWNTSSNGTGVNVYNWTNMTKCDCNPSAREPGTNVAYWTTDKKWAYNQTELTLYAKWVKAASYVYWTDGKWHPIKAYAYNGGWKETVTDYNGSGTSSFYVYNNGWKGGAS